ncbi:MAG: Do family serine endopeptidase [Planctomycetaceae bacterium]|nr:Do family serine endopeptidase [Planctomycetaceae bacterium]
MKSWNTWTAVSRSRGWLLAFAGGLCLGAGAIAVSQQQPAPKLAPAPLHTPNDLSTAFRVVSEHALPSVVSITAQTEAKEVAVEGGGGQQLSPLEEQMFRQFFGNDPQFERFFGGEGGMRRQVPRQEGAGSGFIVDASGIILTNSHVVEGADRVTVQLQDGREIDAESWHFDPRTDVAVVRIKIDEPLPAITLGDSDPMQVGDWVLALGNPFSVGTTVTAGIISAVGRGPGINERENYLQTDAAVNPGNSGGPLVNLNGDVVGINTAISTRSGGYDGISFAIPSNMVRWVADQLIEKGRVERSYLGVKLQPMSAEIRRQLGVDSTLGALVNEVFPDTPAAKAGLEVGDVILKFENADVADQADLVSQVEQSAPGKSYRLTVLRAGQTKIVPVTLESMPSDYTPAMQRLNAESKAADPEQTELGKLGIEVSGLTPELAQRLGVDEETTGVVVRGVKPGSPADRSGLIPGDIIQRVGTESVNSVDEFGKVVESADLGKGLLMYLRRGNGNAFVVVK